MCFLVFLLASFTFYLADSDDAELTTPTGSEDNVISFVNLEPSESQFSGMEPEDELGTLTVSGITSDGFDLSWRLKAHSLYDSFAVEYKDPQRLWDVKEVHLPGNATGSKFEGLAASTEYQIKLYGITSSQRSALLEAVAVTGISFSLTEYDVSLFSGNFAGLTLTSVLSDPITSAKFRSEFPNEIEYPNVS